MAQLIPLRPRSAFDGAGYAATLERLIMVVRSLYLADQVPWVIGYSGGKDSTAVLMLVWLALAGLPESQRAKPVHVISTDTLVENPVVAAWVTHSLEVMAAAAEAQRLPVTPHRLTPALADSFWVNLIGRGYAAPRPKFRWCTERLKIRPSNTFIRDTVAAHGEAILLLGTRKAESTSRGRRMTALEAQRPRDLLSPNTALPNCLVFTPIEDWSNDDVWTFLMQTTNPWGFSNKDLLTMYQGASPDGECPLVVDASTPSCGDSRFGCWVCTLVSQDKSMAAMIQNDEEKEWMLPLLELRNRLDVADDRHLRDFRRLRGNVQLFHGRPIPGPYIQEAREAWLRQLLEAQVWIRANGPAHVAGIELITLAELQEIRRIWVTDKHEIEDSLPGIYTAATGEPYPGEPLNEHLPLGAEAVAVLRDITGGDRLHFELVRDLLAIEQAHSSQVRRAGLFDELEAALRRGFFDDEADAIEYARARQAELGAAAADPPSAGGTAEDADTGAEGEPAVTTPAAVRGRAPRRVEAAAGTAAAEQLARWAGAVVLVGCGARKTAHPATPAALYTGAYFRACLAAAVAIAPRDDVLVLSARHGLLGLDDGPVEPYELTLGQPGAVTAAEVRAQAATRGISGAPVVALCGFRYAALAAQVWAQVATPLAGLGIGWQRHVLATLRGAGSYRPATPPTRGEAPDA